MWPTECHHSKFESKSLRFSENSLDLSLNLNFLIQRDDILLYYGIKV